VASSAGVTPAYLSRLENGKVSPTVSTLSRVMRAMDEPVARLFTDEEDDPTPVVRRVDRRFVENRGVRDYLVTPSGAQRLKVLETEIAAGAGSGSETYSHSGDEECILVLAGALRIWLESSRYDLGEGDSITFPCGTGHRWVNTADVASRMLWIITPGSGY
jgi:uncharacterized cupin superfamily protein